MKQIFVTGLLLCISLLTTAQTEMADTLRTSGKIYIVVAVLSIILIGLFIYLFKIEKRVEKFEESLKER